MCWPQVQLWPQQHSYDYSCNLPLRNLSALLPLIMSQCDESDRSHYHADLVLTLNICCFHPILFAHIICHKAANKDAA